MFLSQLSNASSLSLFPLSLPTSCPPRTTLSNMLPRNSKANLLNSKNQPRLEALQFFEVEKKNFSLGRPPPTTRPSAGRPPATRSTAGRLPIARSSAGPERKSKLKTSNKRIGISHRTLTTTLSVGQIDFRQRRFGEPKPFLKSKSFSSGVAPLRVSEYRSPPSSPLAISSAIVASNRPEPSTMRRLVGPKPKIGPLSGPRRVKISSEPILDPTDPPPMTQIPSLRRQDRRVQKEDPFSLETEAPAQLPAFLRRQARRAQEDGTCSSSEDGDVLAGDNPLIPTIILSIPPLSDAASLPHIGHQTPGLGVATRLMTPSARIVVADSLAPPDLFSSTVTPPCKQLSRTPVNPPNRPTGYNAKGRRKGYNRVMSMQDDDVSPATVRILEAVAMKAGIDCGADETLGGAFDMGEFGNLEGVAEMLLMGERGVMENPFL